MIRSPLGRLLHALNQPLTGLQCAMEVALASPRTNEQYVQGLREGLELTERMRALVEAIREVAEGEEEDRKEEDGEEKVGGEEEKKAQGVETVDLKILLREVLEDLKPVAEVKSVRVTLDCGAASSLGLRAGRERLGILVFRCVESILSLADAGSALQIDAGGAPEEKEKDKDKDKEAWIRLRWHAASPGPEFSRTELGLLVAQAGWERAGAKWERERAESQETVTVRLPRVPVNP